MGSWRTGESTIEYLLKANKLERLSSDDVELSADGLFVRAQLRLTTARAGFDAGDVEGAFVSAYDAYRMIADSLLVRQGLRATGGLGSHATVEDAIAAQFSEDIVMFAKPTFERFRRSRNTAQYFDPEAPDITESDAKWAIATAEKAAVATSGLIAANPPTIYLEN